MSSRKPEAVTAVKLLDETVQSTTSSVVDLKLSKADLFDLVINETETELDAEVKAAERVMDKADAVLTKATEDLGRKASEKTALALVEAARCRTG